MGFYYWQTTWKWSKALQTYCQTTEAKTLYVRFFDVDWNAHEGRALPVSPLRQNTENANFALPTAIAITPTIFITNRTMLNLPDSLVGQLAEKITEKTRSQMKEIFPQHSLAGLQLDCDWSDKTREKYFALCRAVKQRISPAVLSVTIRLHQVKYPQKTGLPPVDKGVLMCYNVGKLDGSNTQNSILDLDIVRNYAPSLATYPLPLDLALPAFAWGVLKRNGKVIKLLNQVSEAGFQNADFERVTAHSWRVKKAHYHSGTYLYEGDEIRLERISEDLLRKAMQTLSPYFRGKRYTLLLYHLHEQLEANLPAKSLRKLFFPI